MLFSQKSIGANVTLNLFKTDKFKSNYVSINFIQPLSKDNAAAFSLLSRVLKRGCKKYKNQKEISRRLEELYASDIYFKVSKIGDLQVLNFSADMLNNDYSVDGTDITGSVIELLCDIILDPLLDEKTGLFLNEYVESEKEKLIDTIKAERNNKNKYAVSKCIKLMCANETFGISEKGTEGKIKATTPEKLIECYKKMISDSKIQIFFVGSFELDNIEKYATPFAELTRKEEIALPKTQVIRKAGFVKTYTEEVNANQGKLSMGFRTSKVLSDEDYDAFPLFIEVFGGSPTSKLFMNVREKMSLCYYCTAMPDAAKGIMIVTAGIENGNKTTAENEIVRQLEDIKQKNISDDEMNCAKASLKNSYMSIYDSPQAIEGWYFRRVLNKITVSPSEFYEKIEAASKEDLAKIAEKITLDTIYFMKGVGNGGEDDE
jgi:predicted Zn-dependent peptidase